MRSASTSARDTAAGDGAVGEADGDAFEDGELGLALCAAGDLEVARDGGRVLDQDALDVIAPEAPIAARVDPDRR